MPNKFPEATARPATCVKCGHEIRFSDNEGGTCEIHIVLEQAELGVETTVCGCFCQLLIGNADAEPLDFERWWDEYQRPWLPNGVGGYEHAKKAWGAARDQQVNASRTGLKELREAAEAAQAWIAVQVETWTCQHEDQPMRCSRCSLRAKAKELAVQLRAALHPQQEQEGK